jgi:hypothetical protein
VAKTREIRSLGTTRDPTTYETIIGAKDIPRITYTPSQKQTGERKRRKKFTPAAAR